MARIEIYDESGERNYCLDFVSANSVDLFEIVSTHMENFVGCKTCRRYVQTCDAVRDDREKDEYECKECNKK